MHRVLVAVLAAFDAALAAAVGLVVVLAPLTVLWVAAMGQADWPALWPATGAVWQLGHLAGQTVHLPDEYRAVAGIPEQAATFVVSLAPLALTALTALFGARSGSRAARAGLGGVGVAAGAATFAAIAAVVAVTARSPFVSTPFWQAIIAPTLVFVVPAVLAAVAVQWRERSGTAARLRERMLDLPGLWPEAPALVVRGAVIALVALTGAGALALLVALIARGDEIVALYQAGNLDAVGVVVVSLAQLAYLPTLVVWALAFVAGPGFAVGTGTAVSPAGTAVGVVPGLPILGALPESVSPWLLLVVLLPIAAGALAGGMLRAQVRALTAQSQVGLRAALAAGTAALGGGGAALLAWLASGSIGPGRLAHTGPEPGAVALAVGVELFVGAAVLLLGPERAGSAGSRRAVTGVAAPVPSHVRDAAGGETGTRDEDETATRAQDETDTGAAVPTGARTGDAAHVPSEVRHTDRAEASSRDRDETGARDEDETDTVPIDPGFLGDRDD
ncbi:DUF6350 family protein [Microbacterium luticocti]|uniref:cell division protein PerM n=1 Tax=Microbacterium luticocti TaxID=451764 RepID=UPI0003FCB1F1|nr:DUF6350 family protein [Microbacterium luticocti]